MSRRRRQVCFSIGGHHQFSAIRPFFCQVEAVEVAIWLTEVAPKLGARGKGFLEHLVNANNDANPGLDRLALKCATGAGKTTVIAPAPFYWSIPENYDELTVAEKRRILRTSLDKSDGCSLSGTNLQALRSPIIDSFLKSAPG